MLGAILIGRVVKRLDPEEECNDLTFKPKRMHWTTYKTDATARSALCCRHIVGRGSVPQGSPRAPQPEADLKLGVRSPPNRGCQISFVYPQSICVSPGPLSWRASQSRSHNECARHCQRVGFRGNTKWEDELSSNCPLGH